MAFTQASLDAEIAQKLAPNGQNSITATILSSVMDDVVAAIFQGVGFAPVVVQPSSAPSSVGTWTSFAGAFGGDNSKIVTGVKYNLISGTPIPTSGATPYAFTPELTPDVSFMVVGSGAGANFDTADNGGRTGVANRATYNIMLGQGDSFGHYFNMTVGSSRSGATSFLANPCIVGVGGGLFGGANGAFITPVSWAVYDQGFDVAFVGDITTGTRTNDTGALGALWTGYYPQSAGSKAWDVFYFGQGKTKMGIDLTAIATNPSGTWTNAAIVLKSLDRMYFNGTPGGTPVFCSSPGTDFIYHNGSGIIIVSGNATALQVYSSEVIVSAVPLLTSNVINTLYSTGTPAAASATPAVTIGSALVGIYAGTGSPSGALTAPKGSIYIRTDGSSGATRIYVNTDSSTTWTAVNTVG